MIVGLLLAQGLYYGLRQLYTAGVLVTGDAAAHDVWSTLYGILLAQALQALGLLLGGMLAGANQRLGIVFGAVVGVWNGILFVIFHQSTAALLTPVTLYGVPILQMAFGALGGFIGSRIWKPLPTLAVAPPLGAGTAALTRKRLSLFAGPVAWGRVLVGATVAAGGAIWANAIFKFVLDASEGKLSVESHLQDKLITWEITALAMLAGSALAGATTMNSLKQGLCVGLGCCTVFLGSQLGANSGLQLDVLLFGGGNAVALGMIGGWFGGQLFPPIEPKRRKRGFSYNN